MSLGPGIMYAEMTVSPYETDQVPIYVSQLETSYSNGGTSFNLAPGTYTQTPVVIAKARPYQLPYSPTTIFDEQVTYSDTNTVTVRVNKTVNGVTSEAADNDVYIAVVVIGP